MGLQNIVFIVGHCHCLVRLPVPDGAYLTSILPLTLICWLIPWGQPEVYRVDKLPAWVGEGWVLEIGILVFGSNSQTRIGRKGMLPPEK